MASVTFGPSSQEKKRYFNGFRQISVCISLPIFGLSLWPSITICNYVCVREDLAECDCEQNQNSVSKQKADLGVQYATNSTHQVPLLNRLSFPVDLFVYLIMLLTGLLLSFHDLSQVKFLLCISSNSSIRMECLLLGACVKCLVPSFNFNCKGPFKVDRTRDICIFKANKKPEEE